MAGCVWLAACVCMCVLTCVSVFSVQPCDVAYGHRGVCLRVRVGCVRCLCGLLPMSACVWLAGWPPVKGMYRHMYYTGRV